MSNGNQQFVMPFIHDYENIVRDDRQLLAEKLKARKAERADFLGKVVGQLIKKRNKLGLTQETVNDMVGIADRLLSKWECGDKTPTSFNLYCWAEALNCEIVLRERRK